MDKCTTCKYNYCNVVCETENVKCKMLDSSGLCKCAPLVVKYSGNGCEYYEAQQMNSQCSECVHSCKRYDDQFCDNQLKFHYKHRQIMYDKFVGRKEVF